MREKGDGRVRKRPPRNKKANPGGVKTLAKLCMAFANRPG